MPLRSKNYKDKDKFLKTRNRQRYHYYAKTARYPRRLWTEEECRLVLEHKLTDTELSQQLKRGVRSIQLKRIRLRRMFEMSENVANNVANEELQFIEGNFYYTENGIERCHWCNVNGEPELVSPKKQILAKVPTYEEYTALKDKLDIAVKALEEYAYKGAWFASKISYGLNWSGPIVTVPKSEFKENGYEIAQEALAKINGDK